jgi:hypothetical protein
MLNLKWDTREGEGAVVIKPDFNDAHRTLQLDALQDWIHDLQKLYDSILQKKYPNDTPNT